MLELTPFEVFTDVTVHGELVTLPDRLRISFRCTDENLRICDSLSNRQQAGPLERTDDLWKTTCFEAFWGIQGSTPYWELNLSAAWPKWNLYYFENYRTPSLPQPSYDYRIENLRTTKTTMDLILVGGPSQRLEGNLSAVIRTENRTHYFSQAHADTKPNFHDRRAWRPL